MTEDTQQFATGAVVVLVVLIASLVTVGSCAQNQTNKTQMFRQQCIEKGMQFVSNGTGSGSCIR
jgi:hypothetical protein